MIIMAIDYGEKRVGIASTDERGNFALPRMVIKNDQNLLDKVLAFKKSNNIGKIVIGESKNLDGKSNPIQQKINKFKQDIEKFGIEVVFHPEIMTTVEARRIQGNTDMTDASAAALILKGFLDKVYNKKT